jgi:glycosyltransferase involved in cell wall biosynthesis
MARVTVLVRTKSRPWFLARALRDVAAQSFTDAEVVVINDGGDEVAVEAVIRESAVAERTRAIHVRGQGGRCVAANQGVAAAHSEFLVLHDDDDLWHPDFLARTTQWLDAHPLDVGVMTRTEIRYERWADGAWREVSRVPFWADLTQISLTEMLEVNRAVPICFLYRAAAHEEVGGYDESLDAVEDWEFSLRLLARHTIGFIPEALATWTQRPSAEGDEANSMFALQHEHRRDDQAVRDRALRAWIAREGDGLPLFIAGEFARQRVEYTETLNRELDRRHPVAALARRAVRSWRRARGGL